MYSSNSQVDIDLHPLRRLEAEADALLESMRALVAEDPRGLGGGPMHRAVEEDRGRLLASLRAPRALPELVVSHAWALLDHLEGCQIEWSLAQALGPEDSAASDALERARGGVVADGRALRRALGHLIERSDGES